MPAFKMWMSQVTSYFIEMIFWNVLLLVREEQQHHPSQQYYKGVITLSVSSPCLKSPFEAPSADNRARYHGKLGGLHV